MHINFKNVNYILPVAKLINCVFKLLVGGNKRPVFYDINPHYQELLQLEKSFDIIRKELDNLLLVNYKIPRFHELDPRQKPISYDTNKMKNWRIFPLYCFGHKPKQNRELCPKTSEILDKIPTIYNAFFSILEGGKSIPLHSGPYCGVIRYHLALKVPTDEQPILYVNDKSYIWREGEAVMFDDTWNHQVINQSEDIRVVLFLDIRRKNLPGWLDKVNGLLLSAMGTKYGALIMKNLEWIK